MVLPKNNRPHTNSSCGACCFYEESGVKVYWRGPLSGGRTFLFSKGLPLPSGFARCLAFLCFRGDGTIRLWPDGDNAGYSGSCGGNRRVCPELRNENLPDGHEQHGERGACDEAVHAEKDESPQRGQQHEEVRQLGVPADEQREEEFVGKEANIRKVDCRIYKAILYQLEIRQIFLDTSLSLKKLSDLLETNQTYLSNVVNKYFGCNLKELVNGYRVEYAKELLSFGRCALNDLPRSCGFASKSAFYSAFSKVAGVSPLSYQSRERRKRELQVINELRY